MPLPPLDERGLLPDGLYESSLSEIRNMFAFNGYRAHIFENFKEFLAHIYDPVNSNKYIGITRNTPILLSGGFFTDKDNPDDIDCVFLLDGVELAERWFWAKNLREYNETIKSQYRVDFNIEIPSGNNFVEFFRYVGPKEAEARDLNPKDLRGIIRLKNE